MSTLPKVAESGFAARIPRWTWLVGLGFLALICAAFILLLIYWPFTEGKVSAALQTSFQGTVQMKGFHRTYFPAPGCVLEGLTVRGTSQGAKVARLTAHSFNIRGAYSRLLTGSKRIDIRGDDLHVVMSAAGAWNKSGIGSGSKITIGDLDLNNLILDVSHDDKNPLRFLVHRLDVGPVSWDQAARFNVAMTNALPPGEIIAKGTIGPWPEELRALPVSGSYTFEKASLDVFPALTGTLSSEGIFEGVLGKLNVSGKARIPDFTVEHNGHSVDFDARFQAQVNATAGDVLIRNSAFYWGKTTILTAGAITGPKGQGKTVDLDLQVSRGRIEDLMRVAMHGSPTLDGPAVFRGRALLPPGGEKFIKRIRFTADFSIQKARFTASHAQFNVDKLSERALGDKDDDPDLVSSDLKGHLVLRDGIATISDGVFAVPAAVVHFSGTCNMVNKTMDLNGHLLMRATVSQAETGFKSVLLKVVDPFFKNRKRHAGADVPIRMTGSFSQPQFGVDLHGSGKSRP